MKFTAKKLAEIVEGKIISGNENIELSTYSKDTRVIKDGDTYFGIYGDNFDGNKFYNDAFDKGAICAVIENEHYDNKYEGDKVIILVDNTIAAIRKITCYIRGVSKSFFVGVTGSVGKTSTRDMIASVLGEHYITEKTLGNENNKIGLPFTFMRINENTEASVIEMGMNHLLELDNLSKMTKPDISVITNVGTAHIGELGSRENILKAKLEILNGMDENGILIINNDNDMLHNYYLGEHFKNIITIGITNESDYMAYDLELLENESYFSINYNNETYRIHVPIPGDAFIYNALVSFVIGVLKGLTIEEIQKGINNVELTKNRLEKIMKDNITIIADAYNASYDSVILASSILERYKQRKILVLGDIFELGEYSESIHKELGEKIADKSIDELICVGDAAKYIMDGAQSKNFNNVKYFTNIKDAGIYLKANIKNDDVILFKASNGMKFKDLISDFMQ